MYAIIESGGRQVRVDPGALVTLDHLVADPGQELTFDRVLLVEKDSGQVLAGAPYVADVRVVGVVTGDVRGPKIRVFKKKRRKGMRKVKGHRSLLTQVMIKEISA